MKKNIFMLRYEEIGKLWVKTINGPAENWDLEVWENLWNYL